MYSEVEATTASVRHALSRAVVGGKQGRQVEVAVGEGDGGWVVGGGESG